MNPGDRLNAGRAAAAAGRYEEALREYVWFHDEALKIEPAYYGVRLSYALSDWLELSKHYPEARTTLLAIRDRKTDDLLRGDGTRELFHDVAAINECLGEGARTHSLFCRLAAMAPELARSCRSVALPVLVAADDFDLAKLFLPEIEGHVRSLATRLDDRVRDLQERPGPDGPHESIKSAIMFGTAADLYAEDVRLILKVLNRTGRQQEAARLRADALALVADDSMREKVRLLLPEDG